MIIALLTEPDAERYRALMLEAYALAPDAFTSTTAERVAEPLSWWTRRVASPDGLSTVFGAFEGPELVGAVALEFFARARTRHKAHLIGLYVQPGARGHGTGRALVEGALAHLNTRTGITSVVLTVTEGNGSAIRLYQRAGFAAFGTEPIAVQTPGGYQAKVHMWRAIG